MSSDQGLVGRVMQPVDVVGELLFGRRLRLRVLLWVAEQDHPFNQSEAARGVGYSSSGEVAKELERLVQLQMLRKYGRPTRVGPQNYVRTDHVGWEVAAAARTMVDATADPHAGEAPEVVDVTGLPRGTGRGVRHDTST